MADDWAPVAAALAHAAAAERTVQVWLRDDDAVTTTPALDRLTELCRRHAMPVLLAVIPSGADRQLAAHVAAEPLITPTQHGFAHVNHAGAGARACEVGGDRPVAAVLGDLARGRDAMLTLFGPAAADVLVPPWNRIAPAVLPHLPGLGFGGLSTFAEAHRDTADLDVLNSTLDIIDWRGGRRCQRLDKLTHRLGDLIGAGRPIGILTHHLVHDEAAWAFLDAALARLGASPQVTFASFDALRRQPPA